MRQRTTVPKSVQKAVEPKSNNQPKSIFSDPFLSALAFNYVEPGQGAAGHIKMNYALLKRMASTPVPASIIRTRVNQVSMFCSPIFGAVRQGAEQLGFRVKLRDKHDSKYTKTEERMARELTTFIWRMGSTPRDNKNGRQRPGFSDAVSACLRDSLAYDQWNMERIFARNGQIAELWPVDGSTMRLAKPGGEYSYVQVIDGMPRINFKNEDIIFFIRNNSNDIERQGYGYGELEDLIGTVTSMLFADQYNQKALQGFTSKGVLNLKGDIDPETLKEFRYQWQMFTNGLRGAQKIPVLSAKDGAEYIQMSNTSKDMEFLQWQEYLIKIACAIYQIDPAEINFDLRGSAGQKPMFESTPEARLKQSRDKGLRPLLKNISDMIDEEIMYYMDEDWQFEFVGIDAASEDDVINRRSKESSTYKTIDEVRQEAGLDPLGPEKAGDCIMSPTYVQLLQSRSMAGGIGAEQEEEEYTEEAEQEEEEYTEEAGQEVEEPELLEEGEE